MIKTIVFNELEFHDQGVREFINIVDCQLSDVDVELILDGPGGSFSCLSHVTSLIKEYLNNGNKLRCRVGNCASSCLCLLFFECLKDDRVTILFDEASNLYYHRVVSNGVAVEFNNLFLQQWSYISKEVERITEGIQVKREDGCYPISSFIDVMIPASSVIYVT